jgi:hypothetical protein
MPYPMRSPWFEFVEFGPGQQASGDYVDAVIDRDESATQTLMPIGTGFTLYTKCEIDERVNGVRPFITVRGRKTSGRDVRSFYTGTGYIDGERIDLNGDTGTKISTGTASFDVITSIIKPITNGYVELWATNGSTNTMLSAYGPKETSPSYHAYFLPTFTTNDASATQTVLLRGRRRFYPITSDDDIVIISNVQAMKNMIMALQKQEVSDMEGYQFYKNAAIGILVKEAKSYRGKARTPAIQFDRGNALGNIPYYR